MGKTYEKTGRMVDGGTMGCTTALLYCKSKCGEKTAFSFSIKLTQRCPKVPFSVHIIWHTCNINYYIIGW